MPTTVIYTCTLVCRADYL